MANITETRELIAGVAVGIIRARAAYADKKVSWFEILSFLGDAGKFNAAVRGIDQVPREFIDLTDEEYEILREDITKLLVEMGLSHRNADVTDRIMKAAYDIVIIVLSGYSDVTSLPPSAILAE